MLAANDCRFQVKSFLQRSSSFSLASTSCVQRDNESWHARQRTYHRNTYNLNSYDCGTRAWADVHAKKPYHNFGRRSPLIFSIFLHQISSTRVQSNSETTSHVHKTHIAGHEARSSRLAPQCLAFPQFIFFCFLSLSQLSEPGRVGTALSGPAGRRASAMTFSRCDTSPTVDCCTFIFNLSNAESRGTWKGWRTFASIRMNCQAVVRRH